MNASEDITYQSKLSELRMQLNGVDEDLIKLLIYRFSLTNEIGKLKQANNQPIYDQLREASIIQKISETIQKKYLSSANDKLNPFERIDIELDQLVASVTEIYCEIMNQSKICQSELTTKK